VEKAGAPGRADGSLCRRIRSASFRAAARAEIAKLQRILGKKTLENEILREAVEVAAAKKWIARSPLLPKDEQ
jgi:hypothetical protein